MGSDANGATEGTGEAKPIEGRRAEGGTSRRRVLRLASGAGAALAGVGTTGLHGVAGAATSTASALPAPTDLVVTGRSETTLSAEWAYPADAALDHFRVYANGNGYPPFESERQKVYLTVLDPDTTYEVAVEAVAPDGTTSARATTTATTDAFDVGGVESVDFAAGYDEERSEVTSHAEVYTHEDFGGEGPRVTITGRLHDLDRCTSLYLGEVSLSDGTLSVLLTHVPVGPADCASALIPDGYRVLVELDELPDAVEVRHPHWERSAPIEEWGIPTIEGERPRDLDDDGRYMDLNANGKRDVADAVTYYQHSDDPALTERPDRFDYDGDGDLDATDARTLLGEL